MRIDVPRPTRRSREGGNPSPTGCAAMTPDSVRYSTRPDRVGNLRSPRERRRFGTKDEKTDTDDLMNHDNENGRPMSGRLLGIAYSRSSCWLRPRAAAATFAAETSRSTVSRSSGSPRSQRPAASSRFSTRCTTSHRTGRRRVLESCLPPTRYRSPAGTSSTPRSRRTKACRYPRARWTAYDAEKTAELFRINCVVCHGDAMAGDRSSSE